MHYYHTCPDCGANLDPEERCDCQEAKKEDTPHELQSNGKPGNV